MIKFSKLIIGTAVLGTALVFAAEFPQTIAHKSQAGYFGAANSSELIERRISSIEGVKYYCQLAAPQPPALQWQSAAPLPISLANVEEIARRELRNLAKQDSAWQVSDFQISRFKHGGDWYYAVTLKPTIRLDDATDSFTVLLDLSGQPGSIGRGYGAVQPHK